MLIVKFYPLLSHNVIDSLTTMAPVDFSKQSFFNFVKGNSSITPETQK